MQAQNHHHNSHERDELLKQLTILDFMLVDIALFLNTHPDEQEAVREYEQVACEANRVRGRFESLFGPLCSFRSKNQGAEWAWSCDPWPWSREGNFSL